MDRLVAILTTRTSQVVPQIQLLELQEKWALLLLQMAIIHLTVVVLISSTTSCTLTTVELTSILLVCPMPRTTSSSQ